MKVPPIDPKSCSFDDYNALFEEHGGTDSNYLSFHFPRFQNTFKRVVASNTLEGRPVVVDVGAHWLHQSLFYALAGCKVEAFNVPTTFKKDRVKQLANAYDINLTPAPQLETGECFYGLPENSVDMVLFTEILEHITFNPVRFWRVIYHVMKPGGRIIVTTPNFYSLLGRAYSFKRFVSGNGSGLKVEEIFGERTYGHHWKEYSLKEVQTYFSLLSRDFSCVKSEYTDDRNPAEIRSAAMQERFIRRFPQFKPGLHVEIELKSKSAGIYTD